MAGRRGDRLLPAAPAFGPAAAPPAHQTDVEPASRRSKIGEREPLWIAPADGHARGIADGDAVRVFNDRGAILAGARVTGRMRRAVVLMKTGTWYDPFPGSAEALDSHGNPNVLVADRATSRLSQGPNANSCLVQVQKWTGPLSPVRVHAPPEFCTQTRAPGAPPVRAPRRPADGGSAPAGRASGPGRAPHPRGGRRGSSSLADQEGCPLACVALVEGQEVRGAAREAGRHEHLVGVESEVNEGAQLELEEGLARIAVLLVVPPSFQGGLPGNWQIRHLARIGAAFDRRGWRASMTTLRNRGGAGSAGMPAAFGVAHRTTLRRRRGARPSCQLSALPCVLPLGDALTVAGEVSPAGEEFGCASCVEASIHRSNLEHCRDSALTRCTHLRRASRRDDRHRGGLVPRRRLLGRALQAGAYGMALAVRHAGAASHRPVITSGVKCCFR